MAASSANFSKPGVFRIGNLERQRVSYYFEGENPRVSNRRIGPDLCAWSTRAVSVKPLASLDFETKVFQKEKEKVKLAGHEEYVVRGGRDLFPLLSEAFKGIRQIGVVASDLETLDQARKLRDSLAEVNSDIVVKIGLESGSTFFDNPRNAGFIEENDTLGDIWKIVSSSDFVLLSHVEHEKANFILDHMKPHSIFGLCFGLHFGSSDFSKLNYHDDISVILLIPKGMGPFESKPYIEVERKNGLGIDSGFVVYRDVDGRATNVALGWSIALGSFTLTTTLEQEYRNHYYGKCGIKIINVPSKNTIDGITKIKSKIIPRKVDLFICVAAINAVHVVNDQVNKLSQQVNSAVANVVLVVGDQAKEFLEQVDLFTSLEFILYVYVLLVLSTENLLETKL